MNLTERQKEWNKVRNPRYEGSELYCQYHGGYCRGRRCASYDPESDDCIHVLAAQAQVRIAQALEKLPGENEALKAEREELKKTIEHLTHENKQLYLHNTELAKLAGIKGA